jgi:hypothetical protein
MNILIALAPFMLFAIVNRFVNPLAGLAAAALLAVILLARDLLIKKQTPKILDAGTAILFCGLSLYFFLAKPDWSVIAVRLCVDCGLLLIVLISLLVGKPFTLQYARESVVPEFWDQPAFRKTNYVISAVWAAAFALMVVAELGILFAGLPQRFGVIAIVLALVAAVKFTGWYPTRVRQ